MKDNITESRPKGIRTLSLCTSLSRILGMVRDILSASIFGTTVIWDAFVIAFTFPNLFRRLFGEGALNASFVPRFSSELIKNLKEAKSFASNMFTTLSIILLSVVILIELILWLCLKMSILSVKWSLILSLSQVLFPYMLLICLTALAMGILNSFGHFLLPALSPIVLNIFMILGMILLPFIYQDTNLQIYGLAIFILIAGLFQISMQWPKLTHFGIKFNLSFSKDPKVMETFLAMGPALAGMAVLQLNLLIDRFLALLLQSGSVSILFYGERLVQLPLGIFGISISVAALPTFSRLIAKQDFSKLEVSAQKNILASLGIMLPATIGLILLAQPIVQIIFERNAFTNLATVRTSIVLACYSIGLCSFTLNKILLQIFYAEKDLKTPLKISSWALLINLTLNLILMWPLKEAGLALATSLTALIQSALLIKFLKQKYPNLNFFPNLKQIAHLILIAFFFALCIYLIKTITYCYFTSTSFIINLFQLFLIIMIGVIFWFSIGTKSKNQAVSSAWEIMIKKKK